MYMSLRPQCVSTDVGHETEIIGLLYSPSLVAIGLSVGYETWPIISRCCLMYDWLLGLAAPNKGWGTPQLHWIMVRMQSIMGSCDRWEFPTFSKATDSPLAQPWRQANACRQGCAKRLRKSLDRQMPAIKAVQGDCGALAPRLHTVDGLLLMD